MLLFQLDVPTRTVSQGFDSLSQLNVIAQWLEQQVVVGSNPTPTVNRVTQMVESYTFNVECEEVHRFLKNGDQK